MHSVLQAYHLLLNPACLFLHPSISFQDENGPGQLEPWLVKEMDSCISSIFLNEDQDAFIQLFNLIIYENVNGMTLSTGPVFEDDVHFEQY